MKRYWRFVIPAGAILAAVVFMLFQLSSNIVFFQTPTELVAEPPSADTRLRLGGQVETGTVEESDGTVSFVVTDGREAVAVVYRGAPQELFQPGIGVVVEGTYDGTVFHSDEMLVSHDEQYRTDEGVYEPGEGVES